MDKNKRIEKSLKNFAISVAASPVIILIVILVAGDAAFSGSKTSKWDLLFEVDLYLFIIPGMWALLQTHDY